MKSFNMRPYYLAPLLVLAMIACAKRDSNFAKDAAAKRAAEQQKAGTQGTPTASPSPGASPGASPADAAPAADSDGKPADDAAKTDEQKKAEEAKKAAAYEGDLTTQSACENKISAALADNEEEISMKDIATGEEGTYILQSGEIFIEQSVDADKSSLQLDAIATPWTLPADQDKAEGKNLQIACHTVKLTEKSTDKISGEDFALPYDISTKNGFAKHIRRDSVTLSATENVVKSKIYAYKNSKEGFDVNEYVRNPNTANESVKATIKLKRVKGSKDFSFIIQRKSTQAKGVSTKTVIGTYSLKK
jgi:hypothetical protein